MDERYLEDFAVGQTYRTGKMSVERAHMVEFAAKFDPQPFHLDEDNRASSKRG